MHTENEVSVRSQRSRAAGMVLALFLSAGAIPELHGQAATAITNAEKRAMTTANKFYCNIKALSPAERIRHKELTDKLVANRKEIVETEKGYEFQYSPSALSLAQLADWVAAEGKCCPF